MLSWLLNREPEWASDLHAHIRVVEERIKEAIMATRDELITELTAIKDQVVKSRGEFVDRITGLEEKLAGAQPITLEDLAELKAEVQKSDDVNPDPVIEPTPVEPAPEPEPVDLDETVTTEEPTA